MTHSIDSLIEFRRKLVRAKEYAELNNLGGTWHACEEHDLPTLSQDDEEWYMMAPQSMKSLVWDNSIRNVDRMIEELK